MIPTRIIEQKRDGEAIAPVALERFLGAFLVGDVPEYQMSAFLMAVYYRGLEEDETEVFVRCMVDSGRTLDLDRLGAPRVDKHSTGGVGDKVSLVLAPLVAALGVYVPMMSGRGLGHTTGTLDKLEAIPGFRTELTLEEFEQVLERVGCAMIGQTAEIAPLDKRLYALRDVTATVPIRPLIAASIMSKKLAEGLTGLLLDVKVGSGAFVPEESDALDLARTMVGIGSARGLATRALLTAMDRPLGVAIGNGLEMAEAIACLRGGGPPDLRELVLRQAAEMLTLAEPGVELGAAKEQAQRALDSGDALARFVRLVEAQGGAAAIVDDPGALATAPIRRDVLARESGLVHQVEPRGLGRAVVALGGGRLRMDQEIDPGVGFEMFAHPGLEVAAGERIATVHARDEAGADEGVRAVLASVRVGGDDAPLRRPLVSHVVDDAGARPEPA